MLALGLETATSQIGVAIGGSHGVIASFHLRHERRHTEILAPAIEFVCRQADVPLERFDLIAVDVGPGLFSGVRAGVATANALAHACATPVLGVSSLDVLAFSVRASARRVVAVMDALRDEVYYATYLSDGAEVHQTSAPAVANRRAIVEYCESLDDECMLVGDGALRHSAVFAGMGRVRIAQEEFQYPSAGALVALAAARAGQAPPTSRSISEVVYLREPYVHRKRGKEGPP